MLDACGFRRYDMLAPGIRLSDCRGGRTYSHYSCAAAGKYLKTRSSMASLLSEKFFLYIIISIHIGYDKPYFIRIYLQNRDQVKTTAAARLNTKSRPV